VKERLRLCSICNNITDVDPCVYCTSPTRNQRLVCVVEEPTNIATIEKTRSWNGVFHVLHGTLSPLHGVGPEHLRTINLVAREKRRRIGWPICCGLPGSGSPASPPAFPPAAILSTRMR
jgi:recombination protein RecR